MKTATTLRATDAEDMTTAIESDDAGFIREALARLYKNRAHNTEYQNAWQIGVRRCADMIGLPTRKVRVIARQDHRRLAD